MFSLDNDFVALVKVKVLSSTPVKFHLAIAPLLRALLFAIRIDGIGLARLTNRMASRNFEGLFDTESLHIM